MHSLIFQIEREPIPKGQWAVEFDLNQDKEIDYCDRLEDERRQQAIEHGLYEKRWFNEMFEKGDEPDSFVLKHSRLCLIKDKWYEEIEKAFDDMRKNCSIETFTLRDTIDYPFGDSIRWILSDWSGTLSEPGREFLAMLSTMKRNEKLYIGGVFDYHY